MKIIHTLEALPKEERYVFGMGFFDGCHRGHQAVFEAVKQIAKEKNARPGILTFFPHPMTLLAPDIQVPLLESMEEKWQDMEKAGMELVLCIHPTASFLAQSAETFLQHLAAIPGLVGLVTGANFTFGKGALGNSALLADHFQDTDMSVTILPLRQAEGHSISSTEIRKLIQAGELPAAALLLGHSYRITGDVVHGFRRGHEALGFPTANLEVPSGRVMPPDGVYATYAEIEGQSYPAITNVGNNPTFGNEKKTIETFIFDFDSNIYGKSFTLEWVERIREEMKFPSLDRLIAQIQKDIEKAKAILTQPCCSVKE